MMKVFLLNCLFFLSPILNYVTGEDEPAQEKEDIITVKRYVVEEGYLPPIFGSFKYNALLQQFDVSDSYNTQAMISKTRSTESTPPHSFEAEPNDPDLSLKSIIRANVISKKVTTKAIHKGSTKAIANITKIAKTGQKLTKTFLLV